MNSLKVTPPGREDGELVPAVQATRLEIKKRGDLYEVSVGGDRCEEVVGSIVKAALACGVVWSFDGTISLGSLR